MAISYRALRVWQRHGLVFLNTWRSGIAFTIVEPLLALCALGLGLGGYVQLPDNRPYLQFLAPGLLAGFAMFSAGAECSWATYIRMEQQRTFDAMIATPVSIDDVVAGEVLWGATRALETTIALLVVILLFQVPLAPTAVLLIPAMLLQGLLFAACGVLVCSLIPSMGQLGHFFSLFLTPQYMFSGVFFPLDGLPVWAQVVAWFMPLSHGVRVARDLFFGDVSWSTAGDMLWLTVAFLIMLTVVLRTMRRRLIK